MNPCVEALGFLNSKRVQTFADLALETSFLAFVSLIFFSHRACDAALIMLGLFWIVRRSACSPFLPSVPLRIPLLLFLISLLLSAIFSEDRAHSLQQFWSQVPKIVLIFFGALEYLRDQSRYRRLFWASTWVILLIGADGVIQLLQGYDWIRGAGLYDGRVTAHFPYPTFFEYSLPLLPLSLSLLEGRMEWWKRAFLTIAAVAFAIASVLSLTRSVWIAIFLIIICMSLFSRYKVIYWVLIGLIIISVAILPMAKGRDRLFSMADFLSEQRYQRILAWQISYRMFLSRPLLGKGLDFFDKYKRNAELQRPYLSSPLYERVKKGGEGVVFPIYHPHSIYLELLASQGVVGMAAFICILVVLILSLWRERRGPLLPLLATSASLLPFLVCGAVGTSFYHRWSYGIFWLLVGIGMSLKMHSEPNPGGLLGGASKGKNESGPTTL